MAFTNYRQRKEPARGLRHDQTEAEKKLWSRLRDRRLGGFKFRRQVPLGPFFADFCNVNQRIIVEVDGGHHLGMKGEDKNRTHYMIEQGFQVLRFWNEDVLNDVGAVCKKILSELKKRE